MIQQLHSVALFLFLGLIVQCSCAQPNTSSFVDPLANQTRSYLLQYINAVQDSEIAFCFNSTLLYSLSYGEVSDYGANSFRNQRNYTKLTSASSTIFVTNSNLCNSTVLASITFDEIGESGYYSLILIGSLQNASIQVLKYDFTPPPTSETAFYRFNNMVYCNDSFINLENVTVNFENQYQYTTTIPAAASGRIEIPYFNAPELSWIVAFNTYFINGNDTYQRSFMGSSSNTRSSTILIFGNCTNIVAAQQYDYSEPTCVENNNNNDNDNEDNDGGLTTWEIVAIIVTPLGYILAFVFGVLWFKANARAKQVNPERQLLQ